MDLKQIHFLREIVVTNMRGGQTSMMQFSNDNASFEHPRFFDVGSTDQAHARELYAQFGGSRPEGRATGSTVVLANRSFWNGLWPLSEDDVHVIPSA